MRRNHPGASTAAMLLLARLYFGTWGGWLAAAAYIYAPYFATDLYVRSALAEFAAFPFAPLALYGFGAFAKFRRRRHLLIDAVAYGGVLLSHTTAALAFPPLLLGFLAFSARRERSWGVLRDQAAGWLLGLGLGASLWLPAMTEKQFVSLSRAVADYLDYANHFAYLHQLFYSRWGYGISIAGDQYGMSFAIGWSHLLLIAAAWFWIGRTRAAKPPRNVAHTRLWMLFFTAAWVIFCELTLQQAKFLWDRLPLLVYLQFPWRLLGPAALCGARMIAPLGQWIATMRRGRTIAFAVLRT